MTAGTIIAVLSNIPWGQVVENAPKVADGAVKLWNAVTNRRRPDQAQDANAKAVADAAPSETQILKDRLVAMEENVLSLQDQMRASTELIKALAEQNIQLVGRIELGSTRLRRLAAATVIVAVFLVGTIVYLVLQQ